MNQQWNIGNPFLLLVIYAKEWTLIGTRSYTPYYWTMPNQKQAYVVRTFRQSSK